MPFYPGRWFSHVYCTYPPTKKKSSPFKRPFEIDKEFFFYLVLCTCSFLFISQSAKNHSGSNICVTSRRSATSSTGNSYRLSSGTSVDGWHIDLFVNRDENAKRIDDFLMPHTHSKQSFYYFSQALPLANVFSSGAHHLPSMGGDSQNFQITSDLYHRASESLKYQTLSLVWHLNYTHATTERGLSGRRGCR